MRIVNLISAQAGNSFKNRVKNTLHHILKSSDGTSIVKLDFIVNNSDPDHFNKEYECIENALKNVFKDKIPAFSIIFQNICNNEEFVIQYQLYDKAEVQYKKLLNHYYVTVKHGAGLEVFSGAISFKEDSLLFSAQRCFDFAEQILMAEDLNFGHIYRQWNYIPELNGSSDYDHHERGNLHIFNEIKNFFYEEALFVNGKPLVNNIHNLGDTLVIEFNAFAKFREAASSKLNLDDNTLIEDKGIKSKFIYNGNNEFWYTSISDLNQIPADIEQQTIQTLKNIFSHKDICKLALNVQNHFKFIRVNIKNNEDYNRVEEIVRGLLPDVETVITSREFHQHNSLIEIEGLISC
ncbi:MULTISPECIES: hypothetical protein [unclassified Saccharicrinis]|uniref:hypothetical protein n=1 Tax=unclassified Saccharicrinis TaxID=2646859 RepID=UPI003D34D150